MAKRAKRDENQAPETDIPARIEQIHAEMGDMIGRISELEEELQKLAARYEVGIGALRETILVVDDSRLVRSLIRGLLRTRGYKVLEAESGRDALQILEMHTVQMLVLDLKMPDMDGFELLKIIREDDRIENMPVLICTASRERLDFQKAGRFGVQGAIGKPVSKEALLEKVGQILARDEAPQEGGAPDPESDPRIFDKKNALIRCDGDPGLLREIIEAYMEEYPGSLQRIRRALNDEDMLELEREAHSLKGAAGNVGGKATLDAALALEESVASGDLPECRAVAKDLEKECVMLRNALEEHLGV